jgi:hypothetical protein
MSRANGLSRRSTAAAANSGWGNPAPEGASSGSFVWLMTVVQRERWLTQFYGFIYQIYRHDLDIRKGAAIFTGNFPKF